MSKKKDTAAKTGVAEYASGGAHVLTQVEIEGPKRARALTSPLPHTNCHLAVVPGHKSESIVAQAGVKSSAIEQGGRAEIARTLEADGSASQGGERDDSWRGVLSSPQLGAWGERYGVQVRGSSQAGRLWRRWFSKHDRARTENGGIISDVRKMGGGARRQQMP